MNNFDRIAPVYDVLSRIVFGNAIIDSQSHFLEHINPNDTVLIIGGGTGKILERMEKLCIPLSITYIEQSRKMLAKSRSHEPFKHLQIEYIHGNEKSIPLKKYDVIFTAFFLDVFREDYLPEVVDILANRLDQAGKWIVTDFVNPPKYWQRILIRLMYRFFRITTGLEGDKLLDFHAHLSNKNLDSIGKQAFFRGMIRSAVYQYKNHIK